MPSSKIVVSAYILKTARQVLAMEAKKRVISETKLFSDILEKAARRISKKEQKHGNNKTNAARNDV